MKNKLKKPCISDFKAMIFDLDGTVFESMELWNDVDRHYLERFGLTCPSDLQDDLDGLSFHENAVYFKERFHIEDSLDKIESDWMEMVTEEYCKIVPMKKGVEDFLKAIKKRGICTGIASSNSKSLIEETLRCRGLASYFDIIVTCDDVSANKPAPDVYLKAALLLNTDPKNCLVFEDIPKGIMAGHRAGMKVCAVEDPYSAALRNEKIQMADYFIDDFTDFAGDF